MASGVTVSDGVIRVFSDIKVHRFSTPEVDKQKKTELFCLSEDKKEEGKGILGGVVGQTVDDPYTFVKMLPDKNCDCALYNAIYETKNKKEGLVFVFWAPDSAPLKNKMICASPKDAIKKKLTEIKHELQANC